MKKMIVLFMALLFTTGVMMSQVKIGDNVAPEKGAILDINGTVPGGLLLPNVNITDLGKIPANFTDASVQGQDVVAALSGLIVWNTNTTTGEGVYIWDGDNWKLVKAGCFQPKSIIVGNYLWATTNLTGGGAKAGTFVANVCDAGMFYQFNRATGWSSSDPLTSSPTGQTWNSTGDAAATAWVTANDPCPSGFHVPTLTELTNLQGQPSAWVASGNNIPCLYGVAGRIYGPGATSTDFDPTTQIFLPAAGYRGADGAVYTSGTNGWYWSGSASGSMAASRLTFSSPLNSVGGGGTVDGLQLRCVAD